MLEDGQQRHLSGEEVARALEEGRITRETLVWRPGMAEWRPAGEVPALREKLAHKPPAPPEIRYWVAVDGETRGPLGRAELERMVREGRIGRHTPVWKPGMKDWKPAGGVAELRGLFAEAGPPRPPAAARIRAFLLGTWRGTVQKDMGGMPATVEIEVTYHEDGTLDGVQSWTMTMPGLPYQPPPTVVAVTGTWKVKALGEDRFALTETVQSDTPGMPVGGTRTSRWRIVDRDTIRNEDEGYELHREG